MLWWVVAGVLVVGALALAWWSSGRAKKGIAPPGHSSSIEHERFQRGTDGRAGS